MLYVKKMLLIVVLFLSASSIIFLLKYTKVLRQEAPSGLTAAVDFSRLSNLDNIIPIAILGSGPAGLSSALYGARAGIKTVVFAGPKPMGQLTETSDIENWPGVPKAKGSDVMLALQEQALTFGSEIVLDSVKKIDVRSWPFKITTSDGIKAYALSVVLATGADPRRLGIEGESAYWGSGVTSCAVCDAPYYKDGKVVVIGGGDSAAEEAMQLAPYAAEITIMVRSDKMRASAIMQERLKDYTNIFVQYNTEVIKIIGDEQHVTSIEIYNKEFDTKKNIEMDGVFLAIGHIPNTRIVKNQITMNDTGLIQLIYPTQQTSVKGVYAAGEVCDERYRQAGVAAGDGIKAALDALSFLRDIGFSEVEADKLSSSIFSLKNKVILEPLEKIESLQQFEQKVSKSDGIVVLDFYADYCPSCLRMMPAMEEVAQEFADQLKIYKIDTGVSDDIAEKVLITSLPTILIYKDGKMIARHNKAMNKQELQDMLKAVIA